ncbi:MAG: hypothetical protein IKM00_06410 [Clostridia bacterium]|nr:hypothetical protein [Clostridia bacterium]
MKYFLINENLPFPMRDAISEYGKTVPLPPWRALKPPVCAHPDMLIAKIGGSLLIHEAYREGRSLLDRLGIPYALSRAPVGENYPEDIRLNCLATEGAFLSNEKYVSREALALADEWGLRRVHVRQGYAKCACACVGNAIATMDRGIAGAALRAGLDTLLLESFPIGIEVYDTGFIGGASVLLDERTLGFFGQLEDWDGSAALTEFFESRGVRLVSLAQTPLFDYGGAVDIEI